jgi:hypothetical protein
VCKLHTNNCESVPEYEAISHAWDDPKLKASVLYDGQTTEVTKSLHSALSHFRYPNKSRLSGAMRCGNHASFLLFSMHFFIS